VQYRTDLRSQQQSASLAATLLRTARALRATVPPGSALHDAAGVLAHASDGAVSPAQAAALLNLSPVQIGVVQSLVQAALTAVEQEPVYAAQIPLLRLAPPFPAATPLGQVRTIASQIFGSFLRPNHLADAALTARVRQAAAAAVPPVRVSYRSGQAIVRAGDVVTATTEAALAAAGLQGPRVGWQPLIADLLIALVVAAFVHGYMVGVQSPILSHPRQILLLDALFLISLVVAAFVLPNRDLLPFLFPAAALSMSLSVLLSCELSLVASAAWAVLAGWFLGGSYEMTTYYLVTGLTGALLVQRVRSSSQFFLAGLSVSTIGLITLLAFRLQGQVEDWLGLGTYAAAALVSGGLAAALTLGSFSPLGRLFGVTTGLHLLELSHPNHPLLRRLMVEAPGTYHHSIMIGTLAERAAEQIGADSLLVRVSAYFHDIGKLAHPGNFTENQAGMVNVHEQLDPRESARLIRAHVQEGVALARHYHLPQVIEDGIQQHHGTTLAAYFYRQAVATYGEDQINLDDFRYPGPRPQTRETAILMLADGVEAAVRSSPGIDGDQIRAIIHRMVQERLRDGQLDESTLTLRDLTIIEDSFAIVLQGLSHPRIQYPAPVRAVANE
jgi:putative nucleotidyltransferase with HDIG domain